jgi:hypothetical protein
MKAILSLLGLITFLSGWTNETFNKELEKTYSQPIYDSSVEILFDNLEHNQTQQQVKKDFERFLPYYLSDHITPFQNDPKDKHKLLLGESFTFLKTSLLYMKYLQQNNQIKSANQLLTKNFQVLNYFTTYKTDKQNYALGIMVYEMFLEYLTKQKNPYSCTVFQTLTPPKLTAFTHVIDKEQDYWHQHIVDNVFNNITAPTIVKEAIDPKLFKQYFITAAKKRFEHNKHNYLEILSTKSQEKINQYMQDLDNHSMQTNSTWNKVKLYTLSFIYYLDHLIFSTKEEFNLSLAHLYADDLVNYVFWASLPEKHAYLRHENMLLSYQTLLKQCEAKE